MSESYSTVTLVAVGVAAGFLLSLLVTSAGLMWALLAVIAGVAVYGLIAGRETGKRLLPPRRGEVEAATEREGSSEHVIPLSKEEARQWLDDFLVKQQSGEK